MDMGLPNKEKTERANVMADVKTFLPKDDKDYFFVSYKSDDWRIALDQIVRKLVNNYGLRVYYDRNFDRDNESWCDNMFGAISNKRCKGVIVFLSTKYLSSYACAMEMMSIRTKTTNIRHNNKKLEIIPVIIDEQAESLEQLIEMMTGGGEKAQIKERQTYSRILDEALDTNKEQQELWDFLDNAKKQGEKVEVDDLANVIKGIIGNDSHFRKFDKNNKMWSEDLVSTIKSITEGVFDESLKGSCESKKTEQEIEKIEKEIEEKEEVEKNNVGISKSDIKKATEEIIKELSAEGRDIYGINQIGEPHFYTKRMDEYLLNTNKSKSGWNDEILYRYEIKTDKLDSNKLGVRFTPNKIGATPEVYSKMLKLHKTGTSQKEGGNYNVKEDFTWGRVISKYEEICEKVSYSELKQIIKKWITYLLDMEQQIFDEMSGKVVVENKIDRIEIWKILDEVTKDLISKGANIIESVSKSDYPHFFTKRMDDYLGILNDKKGTWGGVHTYRYEIVLEHLDKNYIFFRLTPGGKEISDELKTKILNMHKLDCVVNDDVNKDLRAGTKTAFVYGCVFRKKVNFSKDISREQFKDIVKDGVNYILDMEEKIFNEINEKGL